MMGVSAGASIALWYAAGYPQIVRVLAVNPVLQINFDMALSGMRRFRGERLNVVVGDRDPSARWAKALADKSGAQIDILPETDHLFSGKLDEFTALPEKYLF